MKDTAIRCDTEEEWEAIKKVAHGAKGILIRSWEQMLKATYGSSFIIFLNRNKKEKGWNNDNGWAEKQGYIVISVKEFLSPTKLKSKPRHKDTLDINFNNIITKLSPKQTLKSEELENDMSYPIDTMVAQYSTDYDRWRTVQNDSITDSHECPPIRLDRGT